MNRTQRKPEGNGISDIEPSIPFQRRKCTTCPAFLNIYTKGEQCGPCQRAAADAKERTIHQKCANPECGRARFSTSPFCYYCDKNQREARRADPAPITAAPAAIKGTPGRRPKNAPLCLSCPRRLDPRSLIPYCTACLRLRAAAPPNEPRIATSSVR